jgi:hypothetical protein
MTIERTIAVVGHGPGGLGGSWRPLAWMPAVEVLRARLAQLAAEGPVCVRTSLEPGFPLMAAAAALMLRDEGLPVRLEAVLAHPLPETTREPRAVWSWARRALARADVRRTCFARAPRTRPEAEAAFAEATRGLLEGADGVLGCWNGRRGNRVWVGLGRAERLGLPVENLYGAVATSLRLQVAVGDEGVA